MKGGEGLNFLKIKNEDSRGVIYITGDIIDDSWKAYDWGDGADTYPVDIREILSSFKNKPVDVYINSGGGDVFAGIAISNMIKRHNKKTTAYIDGVAASIASVIAFGCDEIIIPANAYVMVHKPWINTSGNSEELRNTANILDKIQEGIIATYMQKSKVGKEQIENLVNESAWLTGKEAEKFFNVKVTEKISAVATIGNSFKNYNLPSFLKLHDKEREKILDLEIKKLKINNFISKRRYK